MKLLPGRILVVLLALVVGVALGAGLAGALRTPAPPNVEPIQLDGEDRDETGEDQTKNKRGKGGKDTRDKGKEGPPSGNNAPVQQNDPPAGGAPPPPPPPPPDDDDDDDDDGGGETDDGGGDD